MIWVLQKSTLWTQVNPGPDPQASLTRRKMLLLTLGSFQSKGSGFYFMEYGSMSIRRKHAHVGMLNNSKNSDPAAVFFLCLSSFHLWINLLYSFLTQTFQLKVVFPLAYYDFAAASLPGSLLANLKSPVTHQLICFPCFEFKLFINHVFPLPFAYSDTCF